MFKNRNPKIVKLVTNNRSQLLELIDGKDGEINGNNNATFLSDSFSYCEDLSIWEALLFAISTGNGIKPLVHNSCAYIKLSCTWEVRRAHNNSYASPALSKLSACTMTQYMHAKARNQLLLRCDNFLIPFRRYRRRYFVQKRCAFWDKVEEASGTLCNVRKHFCNCFEK